MTQSAGRTACSKCGSSNFTTVSVCWKCGSPLTGASPTASGTAQPTPTVPYEVVIGMAQAQQQQRPGASGTAAPVGVAPGVALPLPYPSAGVDPVALRAAVSLGLLVPVVAFPVALIFMMLPDRRMQDVGRVCLIWSVVGGVVHGVAFAVSAIGMREAMMGLMGGARGALGRSPLGDPGL
ncbi:MAG: hypothetical protein NT029_00195 [Armatimonadetes bacterium]|nr:hypothetical protein [Armatimonadota bacterium]